MAYISNTTQNAGPLSKYGGANLNMPGSTVRAPQTKGTSGAVWGIPQANNYQFPMPSFNTANSTPASAQPPAPITRSGGTPYKPSTPVDNSPQYKGTTGVASNPTTSTTTLPYGQNSGDGQPDYSGILSGLMKLRDGLQSYQTNQSSNTNKGLLEAPKPSAFSQFTSGLQKASKPSKEQQKYLLRLEQQATKGEEAAREARRISDLYGGEIARVGQLGAGAVAGAKSTGTDVVGRGNANIAAESASNRINALSAAQSAALQGTQQQLTANEQGINAFNNALTGANTQQGLGINALQAGGTLAMPSPAQYGQTVFDPTTGQYTGGNLDPQTQATNLAQQVMSGAMTYDQALASLGYAGQAGTNFLNNAITGAGGNPLQLQARGAGQQANISTQTTAGTDIARQGLGSATEQYVNLNTNAQYANQQASAVSQILASTGLNNISSIDYNKALRNIQERFSDPDRIALQTALREAQIAYTNLLSTAGLTPSGSEAQALSTLNFDHSAEAINASIQQLENAVARRLQAQYGAVQQYNQNLGTGGTLGGNTQGSGGLYDW